MLVGEGLFGQTEQELGHFGRLRLYFAGEGGEEGLGRGFLLLDGDAHGCLDVVVLEYVVVGLEERVLLGIDCLLEQLAIDDFYVIRVEHVGGIFIIYECNPVCLPPLPGGLPRLLPPTVHSQHLLLLGVSVGTVGTHHHAQTTHHPLLVPPAQDHRPTDRHSPQLPLGQRVLRREEEQVGITGAGE